MIACRGSPSDVFFIEMKAMKARRSWRQRALRDIGEIKPQRVQNFALARCRTRECGLAIPETTLWKLRRSMGFALATNTFWVERNDAYP